MEFVGLILEKGEKEKGGGRVSLEVPGFVCGGGASIAASHWELKGGRFPIKFRR